MNDPKLDPSEAFIDLGEEKRKLKHKTSKRILKM
jgi:hypothetical protein